MKRYMEVLRSYWTDRYRCNKILLHVLDDVRNPYVLAVQ